MYNPFKPNRIHHSQITLTSDFNDPRNSFEIASNVNMVRRNQPYLIWHTLE